MAFAAIRLEARACRVPLSRFPGPLVRRVHLDRRELDAAGRAVLARLRADALLDLSRSRLILRAAPDPPPHADRRRRRRPARSAEDRELPAEIVEPEIERGVRQL